MQIPVPVVTQRKVGTCQDQRSPQCCSWLFPGLDLQPWVTCPVDTRKGNQCQTHILIKYITVHTVGNCACMSNDTLLQECVLPGRLLSGWGWYVCAVPQLTGSDAGFATGTRPHWNDPGTVHHSDCSPQTHLDINIGGDKQSILTDHYHHGD